MCRERNEYWKIPSHNLRRNIKRKAGNTVGGLCYSNMKYWMWREPDGHVACGKRVNRFTHNGPNSLWHSMLKNIDRNFKQQLMIAALVEGVTPS